MTDKYAKQLGFTHKAKMYGFSGYAQLEDDNHDTFTGKWWLTDKIVEGIIYVDMLIGFHEEGFKIVLGGKL
jgi:hypothetical protein